MISLIGCQTPSESAPDPAISNKQAATAVFVPTPTLRTPPKCEDEELLCVGLVTAAGKIDDKSINQSAWEGVLRARRDLGAQVEYVHTTEPAEYSKNIEYFAEQHYDVIVTVGFSIQDATQQAAEKYPEIDFIGVDHDYAFVKNNKNVAGLVFPEKQAGYLAGALAAMATDSGMIGAVFGTDQTPSIIDFKSGYIVGARSIDPDVEVFIEHHSGDVNQALTDPEWGKQAAKDMIDAGADVIFGVGGLTGNGALIESANHDGVFCIGVNADQWEVLPEAHGCLISSAVKQVNEGVFELIAWSLVGETKTGNFVGNVRLAPFHDFDEMMTAEAKSFLTDLKRGLEEGEIPLNGSYVHSDPPRAFVDR